MRVAVASRIMARTTIDLDQSVIRDLRERATREKKSMGQVASEILRRGLTDESTDRPVFRWKTHKMGLPLIDLEDKDELYRILDEDE